MLAIVAPLSLKPMISTLCDLHVVLGDLGVSLKNINPRCLLLRLQMKDKDRLRSSKLLLHVTLQTASELVN